MNTIKKIFAASAAILGTISITSCDGLNKVIDDNAVTLNLEPEEPTVGEKNDGTIYIWTDEDTGVQYIVYREKLYNAGFGGITPRLNPDGSLCGIEATTENTEQ